MSAASIRLTPSLRERVWGRTRLAPWFPDSEKPIGEAWYLPERELPLLVKLLFTSERLSVQVHPGRWRRRRARQDRNVAHPGRPSRARPSRSDSASRSRASGCVEATRTGEIEQLLDWIPVKAGETYFTPAHTVHAIGAGIVLCEIQQNSDVTYRLWDYGRPRAIHVEQAVPICDLTVHPGAAPPTKLAEGRTELVRSKYFVTELIDAGRFVAEPRSCQLVIWMAGGGSIGGEEVRAGKRGCSRMKPLRFAAKADS